MCLILFALRSHPDYPLIVAANRDEFYQRPTDAAHIWPGETGLLAGRDRQAGGTWLGINRQGNFAAVTNVRDGRLNQDRPASRGELTADFLQRRQCPQTYVRELAGRSESYNGFNLLVGTPAKLMYCSNQPNQGRELNDGVYGLSNAGLDSPWPKVDSGKERLKEILGDNWDNLEARQRDLFTLLANTERAADERLPDTGVDPQWESLLSSRFIVSPDYGTRASTLVLYHRSGRVDFLERSFDARQKQQTHSFQQQIEEPERTGA